MITFHLKNEMGLNDRLSGDEMWEPPPPIPPFPSSASPSEITSSTSLGDNRYEDSSSSSRETN